LNRDIDGADHGASLLSDQPVVHLDVIHLVDMITRQNHEEFWLFAVDQEHILVNHIGSAFYANLH